MKFKLYLKGGTKMDERIIMKLEMQFSLRPLLNQSGQVKMAAFESLLATTSIHAKDVETGQTMLEYACRSSDLSLAKFCYRHGARLEALTSRGESLLNIAVSGKSYPLMDFLVSYGVSVNHVDTQGVTGLHTLVSLGDTDGMCRLIERGADVNACDSEGRTPLHYACMKGFSEIAELLLELGASLNVSDSKGFTAVAHAEACDHFKLMDRLVQLGGLGHTLLNRNKPPAVDHTNRGVKLGKISIKPLYLGKSGGLGRLSKFEALKPITNEVSRV